MLGKLAVAASELSLDVGRTLYGLHWAVEHGQHTVPCSIDEAPAMQSDVLRKNLTVLGKRVLRGLFVVAHQTRVACRVGGQDAGELALAGHFEGPRTTPESFRRKQGYALTIAHRTRPRQSA